jgi:hypothetical protein
MKTYAASVKGWNEKAKRNTRSIMRTAIQDLIEDAQLPVAQGGNMPVDTGNLRNTLASGLNGSFGLEGSDSYSLTINGMELGDVANFRWTAQYARIRHYKPESFGQGGGMWRDKAAVKWPQFVEIAAKRFS